MDRAIPILTGRALLLLVAVVYLATGVVEWRLGSLYHLALALAVAVLAALMARSERFTLGLALLAGLLLAYGAYRFVSDLTLLAH